MALRRCDYCGRPTPAGPADHSVVCDECSRAPVETLYAPAPRSLWIWAALGAFAVFGLWLVLAGEPADRQPIPATQGERP